MLKGHSCEQHIQSFLTSSSFAFCLKIATFPLVLVGIINHVALAILQAIFQAMNIT
jgi:hypothetical protein